VSQIAFLFGNINNKIVKLTNKEQSNRNTEGVKSFTGQAVFAAYARDARRLAGPYAGFRPEILQYPDKYHANLLYLKINYRA